MKAKRQRGIFSSHNLWLPIMNRFISALTLLLSFSYSTISSATDEVILVIEEARVNVAQAGEDSRVFMHIINYSENKDIQLVEVSSNIAQQSRLNRSSVLTIPAGRAVDLEEDGIFIELNTLKDSLRPGDSITLLLTFAHGDSYEIQAVSVRPGEHVHEDEHGNSVVHSQHD